MREVRVQRLAVARAQVDLLYRLAAVALHQHRMRLALGVQVRLAPLAQPDHHREQALSPG
jgi:hypothetical protein